MTLYNRRFIISTETQRKKVKEYGRDIRNLFNSGKLYDAIDLARKATKEYPVNGPYYLLLQALSKACTEEEPEKFKDEIIAVGERLINNNPNNWGIKYQLIEQYAKWGMKEEAKKILVTMPAEIWDTQEPWIGLVLEDEEWQKNQRHRIVRATMLLSYFINAYGSKGDLGILQKIECRKTELQIENMIVLLVGDEVDTLHRAFMNIGIAKLYLEAGDNANALNYVEESTQDAMQHIEIMHKSHNPETGTNYYAWSTPRNLPWILWEDELSKPQFDIIRNDEKFIKCFELLKTNSRELK